jgi:ribonucleoside-triphosphate reductase
MNQDDDISDHGRWREGFDVSPVLPVKAAPSVRAQVITRRTYNRPKNQDGTEFETWEETVARVIRHQRWLWERAQDRPLGPVQEAELETLRDLILERKVCLAGRTLWLGGTKVAREREASMFNCSFLQVRTVHDVVDAFWLLLQGCGVGFEPIPGTLNGFTKPVEIEVIRSTRSTEDRGRPENADCIEDGEYYLSIGDSAEAWAKSVGKLLAMKDRVDRVILDFGQIRGAGFRLSGYGWISSGDETLCKALVAICEILNARAGQLLTRMDILDIMNHLGTTLSSRRSAEIALVPWNDPEAGDFVVAKQDHYERGLGHRSQSNNSVVFWDKPSKAELRGLFSLMQEDPSGGEPGFINGAEARRRAPWFKGVNPCAEILLGDRSFCNLVEVDLAKFNGLAPWHLNYAALLAARANYRQTCVNLDDGVLQRSWHELNEFLRLCGVGLTGIVRWEGNHDEDGGAQRLRTLARFARLGAYGMAHELGLPEPKAVTTIKPSGTMSKIMDTTEGAHMPLGRFIFNNVRFSAHDTALPAIREAGYRVFPDPYNPDAVLVTLPVEWDDVDGFTDTPAGPVNLESAVAQLERYKLLMDNWVDHNCSITVSYDQGEVGDIIDWLMDNWDVFVGVSFLKRNDPTKTAKDLGFPYLPQEVVTEEVFRDYVAKLKPLDLERAVASVDREALESVEMDSPCSTGACPIR